ncbi:hypothetical protein PHYBLDRAFT_67717 [Phycomyces blakesleeanus NRRL 1555(-)]|uniref:Uncharacterized protein n=1 Tax=Phycomyces blakesleeanus (strain ATCC 8743b / DSM 1359 / FGSC 10004 / NBRC 33097 / NRRL 1555) TaxID=763407 RepID=A0A163ALN5_PHYB8|nr:hypothetical protein PHYBLDRAFT_67717 [Phycomyces blakesleeanus NRRL 1555(-)]OAD74361.1 hypothetical protein PHYBLDRAFT_67717 [Phycomyces blakesleeanus NRRL 1555(-)]|eukprot:XP_018292401.1 hypothetical protein PHYBLDRAFT_67717 [Phycomyces blakesleeanus NRRL 1555(-)]
MNKLLLAKNEVTIPKNTFFSHSVIVSTYSLTLKLRYRVAKSVYCIFIQLLQEIQAAIISLKSGQEALLDHQEALEKKQDVVQLQMTNVYNLFKDCEFPNKTIATSSNTPTDIILRPVSKINNITTKHIYMMIKHDLGIELTEEIKRIVNTCTKIICDNWQLFHLFRILKQTTAVHCFLKKIKTGCVSIILSYSETMKLISPNVTETERHLQRLASSGESI